MKNKDIFKEIAVKYGITPDEVRNEIQQTIDEAFSNPDPEIRKRWENVPRKGDKPTAEEFIKYMSHEIMKRRNMS